MPRNVNLISAPPFNPIHEGLYTPDELLDGYDPNKPASVVDCNDYRNFIYFQQKGRTTVSDPYAAMMESVHDSSIVRGMHGFLDKHLVNGRRPVAIMGGHREPRGSATYRAVARIAKRLSKNGFVVASGGGPGCMEASHLGALFATAADSDLEAAIDRLEKEHAKLPDGMKSVLTQDKTTKIWTIDEEKAEGLARWMEPARRIAEERASSVTEANQSLAVPTWHYGHEPFTPLATHVAKYFLNSIREDVLLALATSGIIFSEGRGGTLQEVFQDAAQIYYREDPPITSMVFFDSKFWTAPTENDGKVHLPVSDLLRSLFVGGASPNMTEEQFKRYVRVSDDVDEVVRIITENVPPIGNVVEALTGAGLSSLTPELTDAAAARAAELYKL